jgi:hypothetical protein
VIAWKAKEGKRKSRNRGSYADSAASSHAMNTSSPTHTQQVITLSISSVRKRAETLHVFVNVKHIDHHFKIGVSKAILHTDAGTPLQWEVDDILCRNQCSVQ